MHILRNTGKRIIFHVDNDLFGETSFSKDKKCEKLSFYIQNNTFIYVWNKKDLHFFMSLYIFGSLNTWSKNMHHSKSYSIQVLKKGGQHGKIYIMLDPDWQRV